MRCQSATKKFYAPFAVYLGLRCLMPSSRTFFRSRGLESTPCARYRAPGYSRQFSQTEIHEHLYIRVFPFGYSPPCCIIIFLHQKEVSSTVLNLLCNSNKVRYCFSILTISFVQITAQFCQFYDHFAFRSFQVDVSESASFFLFFSPEYQAGSGTLLFFRHKQSSLGRQ